MTSHVGAALVKVGKVTSHRVCGTRKGGECDVAGGELYGDGEDVTSRRSAEEMG